MDMQTSYINQDLLALIEQEKYDMVEGYCQNHQDKKKYYLYWLVLGSYLQGKKTQAWEILTLSSHEQKRELLEFLANLLIQILVNQHFKQAKEIFNFIYELDVNYQNQKLNVFVDNILSSLYTSGVILAQESKHTEAQQKFIKILEFVDDSITWYNLAVSYFESKKTELAYTAIQEALRLTININGSHANYYYLLGLILEEKEEFYYAINAYQDSILLNNFHADAHNNLANTYLKVNECEKAIEIWENMLRTFPQYLGSYINLGNFYLKKKQYTKAENIYRKAIEEKLLFSEVYDKLSFIYYSSARFLEALNTLEEATKIFPDDLVLLRKKNLFLPIIYKTEEEIQFYRQHFLEGLEELKDKINIELETPEGVEKAFNIIGGSPKNEKINYFLTYQSYLDREANQKYGQIIDSIMKKKYPQYTQPKVLNKVNQKRKIKVGYISSRMELILARLLIGWIENCNRDNFEVYSYSVNELIIESNQHIKNLSDFYFHFPNQLEETCEQIIKDNLDILVYLEIGLDPLITQLASLRLAPIQCTTWGNPTTTGLSNIDYFLSSDIMEPDNAQEHYSETLVRLPKLGFNFVWPYNFKKTKNRKDFRLNDKDIIYLSCQAVSKYLPQYDYLFIEICRQVPQSKFIFIERPGEEYAIQTFRQRLMQCFTDNCLDFEQTCCFVPLQPYPDDYFSLFLISDVFLDTIGWSGGFTSLDAIACGLPIITMPTELMRGRQSYGMLKILGVTDTIVFNEREYIDMAVELGLNLKFREEVHSKIEQNKHKIFGDHQCIIELENFYRRVARK